MSSNGAASEKAQKLFETMAGELYRCLIPGDTKICCEIRSMYKTYEDKSIAYNPAGDREGDEGRFRTVDRISDSFELAMMDLRDECYIPGKGTWFSARFEVTPEGAATISYNYDDEPDWKPKAGPADCQFDLDRYPRDLEHIPAWFPKKLREGKGRVTKRRG